MKYQVIIIGGGPAGYTAAETAGKAGLSVLLFEKQNLGGVCLNEGCIPTKTLLYSAKTYDGAKHASKYAVTVPEVSCDLSKIIARKSKVVRKLVLGVKGKLTSNNVTIVQGMAQIVDKNTVRCGEETYECENLILCTGSETFIPPIAGIDTVNYWTHRDALDNKELPASLAIVGGGVIGMEFASFFNSMAVQLQDGNIMLNMRDNRNYGNKEINGRRICVTADLGETWVEHSTSRNALVEPTCMASIHKHLYRRNGMEKSILLFCNPESYNSRDHMTLKVSLDDGKTWPEERKILLDEYGGFGYSCITSVDGETIGILYESSQAQMVFQQVKIKELIGD